MSTGASLKLDRLTKRFGSVLAVDGVSLEEYAYRGRTYVEAQRSKTFTLRVSNPTSERVAVAVSVPLLN